MSCAINLIGLLLIICLDRKSTRLNSSHSQISYAVFCLKKKFVVQAFKIPSESMKTTLLVGDHILVNKFLYYFTPPQRSDIIVFHYPWEEDRDFIKRVIGLPGDRVQVRDRHVYVNDQRLHERYAR